MENPKPKFSSGTLKIFVTVIATPTRKLDADEMKEIREETLAASTKIIALSSMGLYVNLTFVFLEYWIL